LSRARDRAMREDRLAHSDHHAHRATLGTPRAATPLSLQVPPDVAGERLDAFLAHEIEDASRSRLHALIAGGAVRVNGAAAKPSRALRGGEAIEVLLPPSAEPLPGPEPISLEILYETRTCWW